MDRQDLDIDLDLALEVDEDSADVPPERPVEGDEGPGGSAAQTAGTKNSHLLTFVVVLFAALELQAILVLMSAADYGMAEVLTWGFGAIFIVSVFAWFIGGMLWFAKKWG